MKLLDKFRRARRARLHERMHDAAQEAQFEARRRESVIKALRASPLSGQELRAKLWTHHDRMISLVSFYHRMAQLEDAGLVTGWYEAETIDGYAVRQRWYKLTLKGD